MLDQLCLIESPMQIAIVLLIALLVFGPNKLPEIGKQLGGALRELRKAKDDMMRQFTLDHEPDNRYRDSYYDGGYKDSNGYSNGYSTYDYQTPSLPPAPDLTDYTIVGQAPREPERSQPPDDYSVAADYARSQEPQVSSAEGSVARGADLTDASKGESNV